MNFPVCKSVNRPVPVELCANSNSVKADGWKELAS